MKSGRLVTVLTLRTTSLHLAVLVWEPKQLLQVKLGRLMSTTSPTHYRPTLSRSVVGAEANLFYGYWLQTTTIF